MANTDMRPVVLSKDGKYHEPAPDNATVAVEFLPLDSIAQGLISAEKGNLLQLALDGKLSVTQLDVAISKQENNLARLGNDSGVYIGANDILSNDGVNLITVSPVDHRITLNRATLGLMVSEDAGNRIQTGTDGGALLRPVMLISIDEGNAVHVGKDGLLDVRVVSPEQNNLIKPDRYNGFSALLLVEDIVEDGEGNLIVKTANNKLEVTAKNFISQDENNVLVLGSDNKLVAKKVKVADLMDSNAELLFVTDDGKLSAQIELAYDVNTGKFDLMDKDGKIVGTVTIPSSRSMLEAVEIEEDPKNYPRGTYLKFTFLLASGDRTVQYLNASAFIDVYQGGGGIGITPDRKVYVRPSPDGGLDFDAESRLRVNASNLVSGKAGNTLHAVDNKLYVAPVVVGDLVSDEDGNALKLDENGKLVVELKDVKVLSADADNLLIAGTDGGAKATFESLVKVNAAELLRKSAEGKIMLAATHLISTDAGNLLEVGKDNRLYVKAVPTGASTEAGNLLVSGADGRPYLPSDLGTM